MSVSVLNLVANKLTTGFERVNYKNLFYIILFHILSM